jgi:hypothetical protein
MTTIVSGKPDGYVQIPVSGATEGTIAALHIVLKHTADVFHGVVDAIAEHYGLNKDEMMDVIAKHPKYTGIVQNPVLEDLGYLHTNASSVKRVYKNKKKTTPVTEAEPVPVENKFKLKKKPSATVPV